MLAELQGKLDALQEESKHMKVLGPQLLHILVGRSMCVIDHKLKHVHVVSVPTVCIIVPM